MDLSGKRILLGISGGIAAYKCSDLVRQLKKSGADIRVVLTNSAMNFITPLTLQAVSGHHVSYDLFDLSAELSMGHIELAKWADIILIAPATANIIAKLAHGIADDLLSTLCLATAAPIAIAPAMNQQMYNAVPTRNNLNTLQQRGVLIFGPDSGVQACGDVGLGRMLEPNNILEKLIDHFSSNSQLAGLSITITAGPTIEDIDPVRFIGNYSSGKMGFALAQAAQEMGADVTLIAGPVHLLTPNDVKRIDVKSAREMYEIALSCAKNSNIFISNAAVADFRPEIVADQKIKKKNGQDDLTIKLIKNPDIVASVGNLKQNRPFVVGFAAETNNVKEYALRKLTNKNLDLICANDVSDKKIGFNADENAVTLFWHTGEQVLPKTNKLHLAKQLIQSIIMRYQANQHEKKY